jgi:hypothetical protein
MRTVLLAGIAGTVLLNAAFASGQEMPKPAAEMSQIAFFEGSWTCEGKSLDSPFGPGGPTKTTADIRKDLGGFWQSGVIKATMGTMPPVEGHFMATYDPAGKKFVMFWMDSMGGWSQTASSGWKGDAMVYEGDSQMGTQKMRSRDTFTRSGTGTMKHTWEAQVQGKWTPLGEETCTKKPGRGR